MSFYSFINSFQRQLAKSHWVTYFFIKLRNQANKIIGYNLAQTSDSSVNGELRMISQLADHIDTAFDVGANKGSWTDMLLINSTAGKLPMVHLFEPGQIPFRALSDKFSGNNNIRLNNIGLGDKDEKLLFFENITNIEISSFVDLPSEGEKVGAEVNIMRLDSYCRLHEIHQIDYLKIDCEGFDFRVLLGSSEMLKNQSIKFIQFEYGSGWRESGATLKAASNYLKQFGYNIYIINRTGIKTFDPDVQGEFFEYANFFAVIRKNEHLLSEII